MLLRLVLILTLVPLVELAVMAELHHLVADRFGTAAGLGVTLGSVLGSGLLGAYLARRQGLGALMAVREALEKGQFPADALLDGALILVGATLLVTPGLVTDVLGISLLVPWTRRLYRRAALARVRRTLARGQHFVPPSAASAGASWRPPNEQVIIDVTPKAAGPRGPYP